MGRLDNINASPALSSDPAIRLWPQPSEVSIPFWVVDQSTERSDQILMIWKKQDNNKWRTCWCLALTRKSELGLWKASWWNWNIKLISEVIISQQLPLVNTWPSSHWEKHNFWSHWSKMETAKVCHTTFLAIQPFPNSPWKKNPVIFLSMFTSYYITCGKNKIQEFVHLN